MTLPLPKKAFSSSISLNIQQTPKKRSCARITTICAGVYLFGFAIFFVSRSSQIWTLSERDSFSLPTDAAPVLNRTDGIDFSNTPMCSMRPQNQFIQPGSLTSIRKINAEPPILTVITVTRNARKVMQQTARFVMEQSLLPIRWLIVSDHTDSQTSYKMLLHFASLDRRIRVLNSTHEPGFSNGRMFALGKLRESPTKYFAFLDDDDFFEYTAYEKCIWTLESNVNASMCGSYVLGFGERNYSWQFGFHSGYKSFVNNPLTGSEVLRTSVLHTNCGFDESLQTGMEDWDFYLCVASKGLWGVTIPESLFWYRINPLSLRKTRWGSLFEEKDKMAEEIRDRYKGLESRFPRVATQSTTEFESLSFSRPMKNLLALPKSVLLIIPWMSDGDSDAAIFRLVRELSIQGHRVTIVCTLLNIRSTNTTSHHMFMRYTHDIFTIPAILRLADAPRFLTYLIESRNVETVLITNSQLGYGMLPWLSAKYPSVKFVDYVQSEEPEWKNGGYAAFSAIHQASLDATFTSSQRVREYLIENLRDPSIVQVANVGLDLERLHPLQDQKQAAARFSLGIPADAVVILFLGRALAFRRARTATLAFTQVGKDTEDKELEKMRDKLRLFVIGDGPSMVEAEELATYGNHVTVLGALRHSEALKYIELADIFCLASPSDSVSFVLTRSRRLGISALTSTIGASPEMLLSNYSNEVVVEHSGKNSVNVKTLTEEMNKAVLQLISENQSRERSWLQFDQNEAPNIDLSAWVSHFNAVRRRSKHSSGKLSALHYGLLPVLKDMGVFSDFPEIYKVMQGKDRSAYGTKYRATCGRTRGDGTGLLDLLENPKACNSGENLSITKLRASALKQCWRRCIMNIEDPKLQSGWHAWDPCQGFLTFDSPNHPCTQWINKLEPNRRIRW